MTVIFILADNPAGVACESCERVLATHAGIDEDRAFWVCELCIPVVTTCVPAQVGS